MSDVFISYKAEDRRRIQPLVQALQLEGYRVWWDQHIGTGDEWRQTIERQLDATKCVIVAWSTRSVGPEGQFVRDEATRAQQRRVYVPIMIDDVRIPLGFGERWRRLCAAGAAMDRIPATRRYCRPCGESPEPAPNTRHRRSNGHGLLDSR